MPRSFDFVPLTSPADRAAVREWVAEVRQKPQYAEGSAIAHAVWGVVLALLVVPLLAFFTVIAMGVAEGIHWENMTATGATAMSVGLAFVGAITWGVAIGVKSWVSGLGQWTKWYRLHRFAEANGLTFSTRDRNPPYPGTVFKGGTYSVLVDHLHSDADPEVDYGTVRRVTRSGDRESSQDFAYIALRLDRTLPHFMLDAKRNGATAVLNRGQVLSLEGDFDRYFTLYAPSGYERDALYFFTPDLMALLIDEARAFDVEIVDDWMMLHSTKLLTMHDPALHERVFHIAQTVGAKAVRRSDGYRDERSHTRGVIALGGRRLRTAMSVSGAILAACVVLSPFLPLIVATITGE